jgi:hypothetical protein
MSTVRRLFLAATVLALAACGGPLASADDLASSEGAIVDGTPTTTHPTVGKIRFDGRDICTGTLVGPHTVLTAAHCILGDASRYAFVLGAHAYPAADAGQHPRWDESADNGEGLYDVGLLLLAASPGIAPSRLATTAPHVGEAITLVGFGVTGQSQNDYGTKRIATNVIDQLAPTKLYFAASSGTGTTCYGDSGGPAFATVNGAEVQVGITSGGQAPCETGYAWDTRVDAYADWIRQVTNGDAVTGAAAAAPATDGHAPQVRITSPSNGAQVPERIQVHATISDDTGVVRAELQADGKVVATATHAPWSFNATLTRGAHQLRVVAYDAAGNHGQYTIKVSAR